jgi:hypothetical protein
MSSKNCVQTLRHPPLQQMKKMLTQRRQMPAVVADQRRTMAATMLHDTDNESMTEDNIRD